MTSVSESIMSVALLVAESIAVMRAACSAATDSISARKIWIATYFGNSAAEQFVRRLLVNVVHLRCGELRRGFIGARVRCDACPRPQLIAASLARFFSSSVISSDMANGRLANLLNGKNLLDYQTLRDHRFEFVEHHVDRIYFFPRVALDHVLCQALRLRKFHFAEHADMLARNLNLARAVSRSPQVAIRVDSSASARLRVCTLAAG